MALSIIITLYAGIGFLAAMGSIFISQRLFSARGEQIFFAVFFIAIAGFYLAFTAYFRDLGAWRLETGAVILFAVFGILGVRFPAALIIGYSLHGIWDVVHEIHAFGGVSPFGAHEMTAIRWRTALFAQPSIGACWLFLHSATRVECGLEGACPLMMSKC